MKVNYQRFPSLGLHLKFSLYRIPVYSGFYFALYFAILVVCFMVLNVTFNNISVISWQSVLLVEETGVARENH